MLTAIHVRNVRLFKGDWTFELRPLTVICGTNSAGKSTLLKVPLLLQQSESLTGDSFSDGALRLQGPRLDLGEFRTFVSNENEDLEVHLGLEFEDTLRAARLRFLAGGSRPRPAPSGRVKTAPYRMNTLLRFDVKKRRSTPATLQRRRKQAYLSAGWFKIKANDQVLLDWELRLAPTQGTSVGVADRSAAATNAAYELVLPAAYAKRVARPGAQLDRLPGGRVRYGAHLLGLLPGLMVGRTRLTDSEAGDLPKLIPIPLPPDLGAATNDFSSHLDRLTYLAPLRAAAKRYYVVGGDEVPDFDPTGEYLPYVFREKQRSRIQYVPPGPDTSLRRASLLTAATQWLHYLGTGDARGQERELAVTSMRDVLYEVQLRSPGTSGMHALVDSGFGYSQALPIIVSCLLAPVGATVLIEQPEVHLNPALQVRLAEFLVATMRSGRQVIVETHSEHIVNAIRVLVAEDPARALHRDVGITYLANDGGAVSKVDLSVQADGTVLDWPQEFFGEAVNLAGRLLRAQRQHRTRG